MTGDFGQQSTAGTRTTARVVGELAAEMLRTLAAAKDELQTAAGQELSDARVASEQAAKTVPPALVSGAQQLAHDRQEEAVALQKLIDPVFSQAERTVRRLAARALNASSDLLSGGGESV